MTCLWRGVLARAALLLVAASWAGQATAATHGKQYYWLTPGASPGRNLHRAALYASDRRPQPGRHKIATVPFTLRNLKEDLEDVGSRFDGAPDLEFRLATEALELEQ